jgi:hypothetical protein
MLQIRVLTFNEETVTIPIDRVADADVIIPMLGNRFSEVQSITVTFQGGYGEEVVLHKQSFSQ